MAVGIKAVNFFDAGSNSVPSTSKNIAHASSK